MQKPTKILHSSETVKGGIASYMQILAEMPQTNVEQMFLLPSHHRAHLLPGDPRVQSYPQEKRGLAGCWQQAKHLRRALKRDRPDILFLHSTLSLVALLLVKLMGGCRTPVVYCPHGWAVSRYEDGRFKSRLVAWVEGWLVSLPDVTVNISHHDQRLAEQLRYRGKHLLVENAVRDPFDDAQETMFAEEAEALHVLFVGRLDRQKGYDILLQAFEQARATRKDLRLHVVGEAVLAKGPAAPAPDGVDLVGWVDSAVLDSWYRSADVLVVPSRWEGFGMVVAEAMRNGTPVVCSDRGALPDLVSEGKTGHIVTLEAAALRDCLVSLDKSNLRAMRPNCVDTHRARFSVQRFHKNVSDVYSGILEMAR